MSADETRDGPADGDPSETVPNDRKGEYEPTADEGESIDDESDSIDDENDRFLDEELIPILVVGGLVLFLFPEPVTSSLGLVLVGIGVGLWIWNLLS